MYVCNVLQGHQQLYLFTYIIHYINYTLHTLYITYIINVAKLKKIRVTCQHFLILRQCVLHAHIKNVQMFTMKLFHHSTGTYTEYNEHEHDTEQFKLTVSDKKLGSNPLWFK